MKKASLPHQKYKIKGSGTFLKINPTYEESPVSEMWELITMPREFGPHIPYLFLKTVSKKYITFHYFIGQKIHFIKFVPEDLIPVKNEEESADRNPLYPTSNVKPETKKP